MTNEQRIEALGQDIYLARHNQKNEVDGSDLADFIDQTISWVNQYIPELEKAKDTSGKTVDWNFLRIQNNSVGTIPDGTTISYPLPSGIRKLVVNYQRDLTIQQDGTDVSHFSVVNANQSHDPRDTSLSDRVTVLKRQIIFSRPLRDTEIGGTIIADTISKMPKLSLTDVDLLDILDDENYDDIRQLFIMGVVKNQILPDIVQGGLTPSFAQKYDRFLADCISENNESAEADDADTESFAYITGVGFN